MPAAGRALRQRTERGSGALPHMAVQRGSTLSTSSLRERNPRAAHVLADDIARCDGSAQGEACRLASDAPAEYWAPVPRPIAHRFQTPPSAYRAAHGADRIGRLGLGVLLPAAARVALNACDLAVLGKPNVHDAPHRTLDARDPPAHRAPPSTAGAHRAESPLTADTTMREHPARLSASTFMRLISAGTATISRCSCEHLARTRALAFAHFEPHALDDVGHAEGKHHRPLRIAGIVWGTT